jgi:hypothetical protein
MHGSRFPSNYAPAAAAAAARHEGNSWAWFEALMLLLGLLEELLELTK